MNETIDLCESDSESTTSNLRRSFKRENEVEVITLDDSSCSARENPFLRPQAGTSAKRPKLELGQENNDKNDDSDIEIVEVKDVQKQRKLTPKRKKSQQPATTPWAKRRKSKFQTPFVYRGISSNSRVDVDSLLAKVTSSAKKNKGKMKKRRKMQAKKLNTSAVSPGRKAAAQKKKEAVKQQTRQVLQSQEYSQNKFPRKIARDRKAHVPLQNGKPKFRMEPFLPQPQLVPRDRILLAPKLLIPPRDPNAESTSSRIFGTELSEPLCKDGNKDDAAQAALSSSSDAMDATSGTSQVPASSAVPDSTNNNDCAQDSHRSEISLSTPSSSLPSSSTFQSGWSQYGSNIYNSDAGQSKIKGSLRPIVIDGSNVAMAHGNNRNYSCRGIKVCSDYFRQRGHTVIAFVPRFRQKFALSLDTYILEELENEGVVKFTPSREVDGQRICSYDDRFIVQYAADSGGIIVSNDNFRDLFEEQPLWRDAIRNRVLPYTWVSPTCIMFPPDPLGASGPPLDEFLRF